MIRNLKHPVRSHRRLGHTFWTHWLHSPQLPVWWPLFLEATAGLSSPATARLENSDKDKYRPFLDFLYPRTARRYYSSTHHGARLGKRPVRPKVTQGSSQSQTCRTQAYATQDGPLSASHSHENVDAAGPAPDFWSHSSRLEFDVPARIPDPVHDSTSSSFLDEAQQPEVSYAQEQDTSFTDIDKVPDMMKAVQNLAYFDMDYAEGEPLPSEVQVVLSALQFQDLTLVLRLIRDKESVTLGASVVVLLLQRQQFEDAAEVLAHMDGLRYWKVASYFSSRRIIIHDSAHLALALANRVNSWNKDPGGLEKLRALAAFALNYTVLDHNTASSITPRGLLNLLESFREAGIDTSISMVTLIHTLNHISRKRNRADLALTVYRMVRQRFPNYVVPRGAYGCVLSMFADCETTYPAAIRYILSEFTHQHGRPDPQAYQRALTALSRRGYAEAAREVYSQYCTMHGVTHDPGMLNPILYAYSRVGNTIEAQKCFDFLVHESNVQPDRVLWNTLLYAYARADDVRGAVEVFRNMRSRGTEPDEYAFGTLMSMCAGSGDVEAILYLAGEAERANVPLTAPMMDTLVRAYCASTQPQKAEEVANAAMKMDLKSSKTRLWNTILVYYAHRADTQALLRIQQHMKELRVPYDPMTYAALMLSLTKMGRSEDALKILRALHLSQRTTVNATHYSIVMHGFAREENRNQVTRLWLELLDRTNAPGLSASLAVLRSQIQRDRRARDFALADLLTQTVNYASGQGKFLKAKQSYTKDFPHASAFLDEILDNLDIRDLASKLPRHGLGNFKITDAVPAALFTLMIQILGRQGAYRRATALLAKYQQVRRQMSQTPVFKETLPIPIITELMSIHVHDKNHTRVEELWQQAKAQAIEAGTSKAHIVRLVKSPSEWHSTDPHEPLEPVILPAHRFVLSRALTHYMHSLALNKLHDRLTPLIEDVQKLGFALDSSNWNAYVRLMASSLRAEHQFTAFTVFERKLLPNMPAWGLLTRGWVERHETGQDGNPEVVRRSLLRSLDSETPHPSYYTLVFLGAALMRFRKRATYDQGAELYKLLNAATRSVIAVAKMPYRRDRVQGVILRGRQPTGDTVKSIYGGIEDTYGLLAGTSAIEDVPPESFVDIAELQTLLIHKGENSESRKKEIIHQVADALFGELHDLEIDEADWQNSKTSRDEQARTPEHLQKSREERVWRIVEEAMRPQLLANELVGDPSYDTLRTSSTALIELSQTRLGPVGFTGAVSGQEGTKSHEQDNEQIQEDLRSFETDDMQKIIFYDPLPPTPEIADLSQRVPIRRDPSPNFWMQKQTTFDTLNELSPRTRVGRRRRRAFSLNKESSRQKREEIRGARNWGMNPPPP